MSEVCNMDCFNCPYSDCINDTITLTEIKTITERDKRVKTNVTYNTPKISGSTFCRAKYYHANSEKFRKQARESYYRNRAKIRQRQKKYYESNVGLILQSKSAYYQENKEKIKKKNNAYYHANKDKINARRREKARLKREEQLNNDSSKNQSTGDT